MDYSANLKKVGFSDLESKVYQILISRPFLRASAIAKKLSVGRTLVYHTLEVLISKGLINKSQAKGKVTLYSISNPNKGFTHLKQEIEQSAQEKSMSIDTLLGELQNQYNYMRGMPNIRFYEGLEGLKVLYKDVVHEGHDILLLRSHLDNDVAGFKEIVLEQIQNQVKNNIHTRAIVPRYKGKDRVKSAKRDAVNLSERREISRDKFLLPVQIIIYGNKVGMSSFQDYPSSTIIENPIMAQTFRILFELLWEIGE
jgi:sugar-specific transcriptional regulator TrmB